MSPFPMITWLTGVSGGKACIESDNDLSHSGKLQLRCLGVVHVCNNHG